MFDIFDELIKDKLKLDENIDKFEKIFMKLTNENNTYQTTINRFTNINELNNGYIYYILKHKLNENYVKIGITNDINRRLKEHNKHNDVWYIVKTFIIVNINEKLLEKMILNWLKTIEKVCIVMGREHLHIPTDVQDEIINKIYSNSSNPDFYINSIMKKILNNKYKIDYLKDEITDEIRKFIKKLDDNILIHTPRSVFQKYIFNNEKYNILFKINKYRYFCNHAKLPEFSKGKYRLIYNSL